MSTAIQIIEKTFQNKPIPIVQMNGEKHVVAQLYGKRLGYSSDGAKFTKTISTGAWCTRMHEGKHYVWIENEQLADLKALLKQSPCEGLRIPANVNRLMLLTRIGFFKATTLSSKPACDAFVDWACEEVFPSIDDTGAYVAPGAQLPTKPKAPDSLPEQTEFRRQMQVAFVMNRQARQDGTIHDVEAEKNAKQIIQALYANAADLVTGKPILATASTSQSASRSALKGPKYQFSAADIERFYGIPETTVGRLASVLGLKNDPRCCGSKTVKYLKNGQWHNTGKTLYTHLGVARVVKAKMNAVRGKH